MKKPKHMYIKSIIAATLLALSTGAHAVNMTLDRIDFHSYVNGVFTQQIVTDPNFFSDTYGIPNHAPYATINSLFSDTRNFAYLATTYWTSDIGSLVPTGIVAGTTFYFTLNERVEYSLSGQLYKESGWNGLFPQNQGAFGSVLALSSHVPVGDIGVLAIDAGIYTDEQTGILERGQYYLNSQAQAIAGGQSQSSIILSFNRITGQGNRVPDAGSTLLLLGIALGGLPFMRRR